MGGRSGGGGYNELTLVKLKGIYAHLFVAMVYREIISAYLCTQLAISFSATVNSFPANFSKTEDLQCGCKRILKYQKKNSNVLTTVSNELTQFI